MLTNKFYFFEELLEWMLADFYGYDHIIKTIDLELQIGMFYTGSYDLRWYYIWTFCQVEDLLELDYKLNGLDFTFDQNWLDFYAFEDYILFRIFFFFRTYGFDFKIISYLFDAKFHNIWNILLVQDFDKDTYFQLLSSLINEYVTLWCFFNNSKTLIFPQNYLCDLNLRFTNSGKVPNVCSYRFTNEQIKRSHLTRNRLEHLGRVSDEHLLVTEMDWNDDLQSLLLNIGLNSFIVHFIRNQRCYNKRRYSKVRLYSRPSFFAGICLGSVFIDCFWGGTIKSVDWQTTANIFVNMDLCLSFIFFFIICRLFFIEFSLNLLKFFGKFRLFTFLKTINITNILMKFWSK